MTGQATQNPNNRLFEANGASGPNSLDFLCRANGSEHIYCVGRSEKRTVSMNLSLGLHQSPLYLFRVLKIKKFLGKGWERDGKGGALVN